MSARHFPESNSIADQCNRTIIDKVHIILSKANLIQDLWAESANYADIMRTSTHDNIRWRRKKLDARAWTGIFIGIEGYNTHSNYDLERNMTIIVRNVNFDETEFVRHTQFVW